MRVLARWKTAETKLIRRLETEEADQEASSRDEGTLDGKDVAYPETWPETTDG